MIKFFSANHIYNFVLLPVLGALIILSPSIFGIGLATSKPCAFTAPGCYAFSRLPINSVVELLVSYLTTMIVCFQLLHINTRFAFVKERTFLPAYIFLFVVFAVPEVRLMQPVLLSAIFVMQALDKIFASYDKQKGMVNAFEAAFLFGIAGLFFPYISLFVLAVPFFIFTLKGKSIWNDWAASIMGGVLPWLIAWILVYILFPEYWGQNDWSGFLSLRSAVFVPKIGYILFLVLYFFLLIIASGSILKQYQVLKISARRYFKLLLFFFIFTITLILFEQVLLEIIVLAAIPFSFLMANFLISTKYKRFANIMWGMVIIIAFLLQLLV